MNRLRFDDKVIIVTGAGRGLGAAYAALLAERGATVIVNDLGSSMEGDGSDASAAEDVVHGVQQAGGTAIADGTDVTDAVAVQAMVDGVLQRFGRIDGVINNAGIIGMQRFADLGRESLQRQLDVHLLGSLNVTKAAWPALIRSTGRVVLTASSGMLGSNTTMAYNIAKAAVYGLLRSLAIEGAEVGVSVNGVMPAAETRMQSTAIDAGPSRRPVAESSSPENAAPLTCFLLHPSCDVNGEMYLTGRGLAKRVVLATTAGASTRITDLEWVAEHFSEIGDATELTVETGLEAWRTRSFALWEDLQ